MINVWEYCAGRRRAKSDQSGRITGNNAENPAFEKNQYIHSREPLKRGDDNILSFCGQYFVDKKGLEWRFLEVFVVTQRCNF